MPSRPSFRRVLGAGRGRWWRGPYLVALAYAGVSLAGNAVVLGGFAWGKLAGPEVLATGPGVPRIQNFRQVDDVVYTGAQPDAGGFAELAAMGVTLVVDLRTGALGDPRLDDPVELAAMGMDYLPLPLADGHAPDDELVSRFLDAVAGADGRVYVHCGGGVGRSGALQSAYLAATGGEFGVDAYFAVGPPTLEQIVYVARAEPGRRPPNNPVVAAVSRTVDFPRILVTWGRALLGGQ